MRSAPSVMLPELRTAFGLTPVGLSSPRGNVARGDALAFGLILAGSAVGTPIEKNS